MTGGGWTSVDSPENSSPGVWFNKPQLEGLAAMSAYGLSVAVPDCAIPAGGALLDGFVAGDGEEGFLAVICHLSVSALAFNAASSV